MKRARLVLGAAAIAMLLLVALVYAPVEEAPYVWDDHTLVERDAPYKREGVLRLFLGSFWPESPQADVRGSYYRPLVLLSYRLDLALGGGPAQLHASNVALLLVACALLALVAVRLGAKPIAAMLAALLLALSPRITESVAWISGRTDVLALVFGLGALAAWPSREEARRWPRIASAAVLLFLALLSKEIAIAAAVAIAVRSRDEKELLAGTVAPLGVYVVLRAAALGDVLPGGRELGAGTRALTALEAVGRYAEMIATPLSSRTSIGAIGAVDHARAAAGAVVLVAVLVLGWRARRALRQGEGSRVAAALAGASILASCQIVPIAAAGAVVCDRFLTWPLAGLAIGAALGASRLPRRFATTAAAFGLALAVLFARGTRARIADYADEIRFWVVAAEGAHPANASPHTALANLVENAGRTELACRLFDAAQRRALPASPAKRRAREGLAACRAHEGRYDESIALYEALAKDHPESGRIVMGMGFALLHALRLDDADAAFARALALDPRLSPTIGPARLAVANARSEPKEPFARAQWLALVGRKPEAEAAHRDVALDPAASVPERHAALAFLAAYAAPEIARAAVEACASDMDVGRVDKTLAAREERVLRVDRLRARIEALAH